MAASVLRKFGFKKHQPRESEARQNLQKELFAFNHCVEHGFPHKPTCLAYDSKLKLLAIGTKTGAVKVDDSQNSNTEDFSLSVIATNLRIEFETELRNFIAKRASKGSLSADGQGTINSVTLGEFASSSEHRVAIKDTLCYCCLLSRDRDELSQLLADGSNAKETSEEFIISLLAESHVDLDLFRSELDAFSKKLVSLLEPDLLIELELREELGQLDGLDDRLQPVLESWYLDCTHYLTNCVMVFEDDIKYLLYSALSDVKVELQISDKKLAADIIRFVECCSLSELLTTIKSDSHSDTSSSISDTTVLVDIKGCTSSGQQSDSKDERPRLICNSDGKYVFHNCGCSEFCEDWSSALVNEDFENPVMVKQVIESYKLRAIQDLNTLNRMIKQAETDYYALFRVYVFLTRSGNSSILLRHTYQEAASHSNKDTLITLTALNSFIQEALQTDEAKK